MAWLPAGSIPFSLSNETLIGRMTEAPRDILNQGPPSQAVMDVLNAPGAQSYQTVGMLTSIFGSINSAIGGYYSARSAQYQLQSQASSLKFASDMALLNARSAEYEATQIMSAGQQEAGRYTMAAGQKKAGARAAMAARGVTLGEGSARDIEASMDIVKDIDAYTISANAVRSAWGYRLQQTNYQNQALIGNVSANNASRSASSVSPWGSAASSLIGSASTVAKQWYEWDRRR